MQQIAQLPSGLVREDAFSNELHASEMSRVFRKCWLFLGHESMLPQNNDYFTQYMGEEGVIVQRDSKGKIRVFLNKCRHRGNSVCLYDRGNASSFTCSYHGWCYSDGKLTAVPFEREAYGSGLEKSMWGLVEVPRVEQFGGLIFGCWDNDAVSLKTYLGDAGWYLENFLLAEEAGGLEVLPGAHRYIMPTNWKLIAENFAGDQYHFYSTHASLLRALRSSSDSRTALTKPDMVKEKTYEFSLAANHGVGAAHGFLEFRYGPAPHNLDLAQAKTLGAEAVEWVEERHRKRQERLQRFKAKPYGFHVGNIFPNFSLIGVGSALYGKGLICQHPRGAANTEAWMWCAVEKDAPESVKQRQRFVLMQRQAAAGMVAPDDHENFGRMTENICLPGTPPFEFNYSMKLEEDSKDVRPPEVEGAEQWPGAIVSTFTEANQRDFYRYWNELMSKP
jgi:phenylpropionate dioxygenase-like ring-hydroxylating dioxygenase large terminal subunit